jgi:sec-independent protein translocase protein TatC
LSRLRPIGHEDRLSLVEHLDELRNRLIVSLAFFLVCFSICYWQNGWLLDKINQPLYSAQHLGDLSKHNQNPLEESSRFQIQSGRAAKATSAALAGMDRVLTRLSDQPGLSPHRASCRPPRGPRRPPPRPRRPTRADCP